MRLRVSVPRAHGRARSRGQKERVFWVGEEGHVAKSGNSLVIRIPKEIAESLKIKRDLPIVIYPAEPRKLIIEVER
jgi:hypothetical protein